jgi:general transcription factor IIIA
MTVHENKRPFPCPDIDVKTGEPCKSAFETAEKLRAHQRAKHDQTRFACTECLEHICQDHSGDEILDGFKEGQTEAYFASYADLQLHIATVHPPTCPHCSTALSTPRELKRHLELVHNITDPDSQQSNAAYPCTYNNCNRSFSKKGNLNVHIKTVHQKRRDFVCGETELNLSELAGSQSLAEDFAEIEGCGRDFTSKSSLEEHVRTAHLGLGSKRVERNKKRKAAALKSGEQPEQKKRKSRKGQGKKTAALSALTGVTYDAEEASEDGDDEMGEQLTGFETMVDGQIYGQDLGFTDRVAYGQHTYDPQGYHSAARDNAFSSTDLFNDAEFVSRSPLDPLLLLSG